MKKWKQRLAVLLCALFIAPAVFEVLPVKSVATVEAATVTNLQSNFTKGYEIGVGPTTAKVIVEVGEVIELPYYYSVTGSKYIPLYTIAKKASYKSSNTAVATVDKAGVLTAKKAGTAKITVTYKGAKDTFDLKVTNKGGIKLSNYAKYEKAAKKMLNLNVKKISKKNRYQALKIYGDFNKIGEGGKIYWNGILAPTGTGDIVNKIVVPSKAKANVKSEEFYEFANEMNPAGTRSAKAFKVKSVGEVKAKSSSFKIVLKNKVTADQIYALKACNTYYNNTKDDQKATFSFYLRDKKGQITYFDASVKEGSNVISVKLQKGSKLTKGATLYGDDNYAFLKKVIIKVK